MRKHPKVRAILWKRFGMQHVITGIYIYIYRIIVLHCTLNDLSLRTQEIFDGAHRVVGSLACFTRNDQLLAMHFDRRL